MRKTVLLLFVLALLTPAVFSCKKKNTTAVIETSAGQITLELFDKESPATVKNFLVYVNDRYYNGTIFHRVIDNFMIQGGGFTADMQIKQTPYPPVKNEAYNMVKNRRGTIAMARTDDINSATSQFFINVNDNSFLDHGSRGYGYCVFGRVISGMDVVDAIKSVSTETRNGFENVPVETIEIISIKIPE